MKIRHWLFVGALPIAAVSGMSIISHTGWALIGLGLAGLMVSVSILLTPAR